MIRLLYNGKEITHGTVTIITGDDNQSRQRMTGHPSEGQQSRRLTTSRLYAR
jgi:hypothetical protein